MGINTYNESSLHQSLKTLYSLNNEGKTEVEKDGHIYDILTNKKEVIEIQTQNLSKLLVKSLDALKKGYKVKIVYPLAVVKYIKTLDSDGNEISKRKSPKKKWIYSIFKELTGLYPVLLKEDFTLEVLFTTQLEIRKKTENLRQSKNKKRRFLKNWQKIDKELIEITKIINFSSKNDYLSLIPKTKEEVFTVSEIKESIKKEYGTQEAFYGPLFIWVLNKMNIIEIAGKKRNAYLYKIKG